MIDFILKFKLKLHYYIFEYNIIGIMYRYTYIYYISVFFTTL